MVPKPRRPSPLSRGGLDVPKAKEAPSPQRRGPRWSQSQRGPLSRMVNPSVLWDSVERLALSKSMDTAATVHKGPFGVFQLYTVSKAPLAILRRVTCQGFRAIMSLHDASSSDRHFPGIRWMLANKRAKKHNWAERTTLYIDLNLNEGSSRFGSRHYASFCLNPRRFVHARKI